MIEAQAAIGRIQLRRMPDWHAARLRNAQRIWDAARNLPGLRVPVVPAGVDHAAYKCYVFLRPEALGADWSRERIMREIQAGGVPVSSGRSEERRVGKECVSQCRSGGSAYP